MHIRAINVIIISLISCFESRSYFLTRDEQTTLNDNLLGGVNEIDEIKNIHIYHPYHPHHPYWMFNYKKIVVAKAL